MVTRGGSATADQIEAEVDLGGRRGIEVPALVENHPSIDREKQPVPQGLQPRFPAVQFRIGGGIKEPSTISTVCAAPSFSVTAGEVVMGAPQ